MTIIENNMSTIHQRMRKEKERNDINYQVNYKYNAESKLISSRKATPEEISDMLSKSQNRMCSHT